METSSPRVSGDNALYVSTSLSATNGSCLSFWYHMSGPDIGQLNLYLRKTGECFLNSCLLQHSLFLLLQWTIVIFCCHLTFPGSSDALIWRLSGNQGSKWLQSKVGIKSATPYSIVIEGVRGKGIQGDIAIDDITFSSTAFCTCELHSPSTCLLSYRYLYLLIP